MNFDPSILYGRQLLRRQQVFRVQRRIGCRDGRQFLLSALMSRAGILLPPVILCTGNGFGGSVFAVNVLGIVAAAQARPCRQTEAWTRVSSLVCGPTGQVIRQRGRRRSNESLRRVAANVWRLRVPAGQGLRTARAAEADARAAPGSAGPSRSKRSCYVLAEVSVPAHAGVWWPARIGRFARRGVRVRARVSLRVALIA